MMTEILNELGRIRDKCVMTNDAIHSDLMKAAIEYDNVKVLSTLVTIERNNSKIELIDAIRNKINKNAR